MDGSAMSASTAIAGNPPRAREVGRLGGIQVGTGRQLDDGNRAQPGRYRSVTLPQPTMPTRAGRTSPSSRAAPACQAPLDQVVVAVAGRRRSAAPSTWSNSAMSHSTDGSASAAAMAGAGSTTPSPAGTLTNGSAP